MGYGAPVQAPMSLGTPRGLRSPGNPGLPETAALPFLEQVKGSSIPNPPMAKADTTDLSRARRQDAAQLAAEIGSAYAFSKFQDKVMKAKAKARGRAAQRAAERR